MHVLNLDELEAKVGSKYALVVAVAKRAEQLKEGAVPLTDCPSSNPVTIALYEIAQDALVINPETLAPEQRFPLNLASRGAEPLFSAGPEREPGIEDLDISFLEEDRG